MADRMVTLMCRWNGKITTASLGLDYEGGKLKGIRVNHNISHSELLDKMYEITGYDRRQFDIKITCRYPVSRGYIAYMIDDKDSTEIMLELGRHPDVHAVELYLENEALHIESGRDDLVLVQSGSGYDEGREESPHNNVGSEEDGTGDPVQELNETEGNAWVSEANANNNMAEVEREPIDEFTNASWVNDAVASNHVPGVLVVPDNVKDVLHVGQIFQTKQQLQQTVKEYAIRAHQQYIVLESTPSLLALKCKNKGCLWRLRASLKKNSSSCFAITKYAGPHTCVKPSINQDHAQLDAEFICSKILGMVKAQLSITPAAIQAHMANTYDYNISYMKAWKAKQKAFEKIFGNWEESYALLPRYLNALKMTNPGTIVLLQSEHVSDQSSVFKRVFWAFGPTIEGFKHCRPVISIDSTQLSGKYGGMLLIATGIDGNNGLFPLAFAIVVKENESSWSWFLDNISEIVGKQSGLCIISDCHNDILVAMRRPEWEEPNAFHRICMRHLASNFNRRFHDAAIKNLLIRAAEHNQPQKYDTIMELITNISLDARQWIDEIPALQWALAHDDFHRFGIMTTNMSETINSVLKGARALPITALVRLTFYRLNTYFITRREQVAAYGSQFTPLVEGKLACYRNRASGHGVKWLNDVPDVFEVITKGTKGEPHTHVVNLGARMCTCGKLQIYGYPCSHVIAACQSIMLDPQTFVDDWYKVDTFALTYAPGFHSVPDIGSWPPHEGPSIVPPPDRERSRGRPQSVQLQNEMDEHGRRCVGPEREGRGPSNCSACKKPGHNRRRCLLAQGGALALAQQSHSHPS
ncbi:uncharacterized protein LOC122643903 [Telopea speciosissima]|uniref:uncharacterized protein LOC122643903 n=1 Tax=Telopea speciosissima TaxID=54955 RepID=UPI001CC7AB03|nr:uncharacterized protein LOC122643903 [Telopea speciosissima]